MSGKTSLCGDCCVFEHSVVMVVTVSTVVIYTRYNRHQGDSYANTLNKTISHMVTAAMFAAAAGDCQEGTINPGYYPPDQSM
jgi:hypothetical protein